MANYMDNRSAILYNNDESTIPDISDSSDSPSLPSLSLNCELNRNRPQMSTISPTNLNITSNSNNETVFDLNTNGNQMMTMREYDTKLNELKRENFNLKLRIYILDKGKTGVSQPECESAIAKELLKREKTIKAYQKIVDEKDDIFKENKLKYESILKEKNLLIDGLANDKETLTNELTETSSVCRLLMAHLSEFVEFWKRYLPLDSANPNDMMATLLNSSEDLLNSASVLITNDGNESLRNRSFFGLEMRNATQMSATGMSSLGLLSDMSELIAKSNGRTPDDKVLPKVPLVGKATMTDLTNVTLNNILKSYYDIINKRVVHKHTQSDISFISNKSSQTQTDVNLLKERSIQTDVIKLHDKSIGTRSLKLYDSGSQYDGFVGQNKSVQYELVDVKSSDCQTDGSPDIGIRYSNNHILSTDEDKDKFIPVRTKPKTLSPNSKRSQNANEKHSPNTLYTYKASLSPLKNTSRTKNKESPTTDSSLSAIGMSADMNNSLRNTKDDNLFKVPNDHLISNRTKKQTFINKLNENNKQIDKLSSRLSSSSSSLEGANRMPNNGSHLQLNVNCFNKNNPNSDHLSSPDLGIGDSDFDLRNIEKQGFGLRVYISVGNFKLLKEQLNEAICSINTLDRLNHDFSLNVIDYHEFVSNLKPKISSINQLMNSSRNICRKFVIEDNDALLKRLEKMRISKEKMEKAITKQLHKTDILLKKAKVNLKEN